MDLFGGVVADAAAVVVVVCECFGFVMVIGAACWAVACTGWYLCAYRLCLYLCLGFGWLWKCHSVVIPEQSSKN